MHSSRSLLSLRYLQNGIPSGFVMSFVFHIILALLLWIFLKFEWKEEKAEEVSIQVYTGPETGVVGDGSGVGQGSARPALKKETNEFSGEKNSNTKSEGSTEGRSDGFADGKGVDWGSASDPALDGGSRYTANIVVDISPDDYPASARRSNLGNVVVAVTLYISSAGKIRDVRIRYVRGQTGSAKNFEKDFITATRNIFLNKARLNNVPYSKDGKPKDFIWDTTVTYVLQ